MEARGSKGESMHGFLRVKDPCDAIVERVMLEQIPHFIAAPINLWLLKIIQFLIQWERKKSKTFSSLSLVLQAIVPCKEKLFNIPFYN